MTLHEAAHDGRRHAQKEDRETERDGYITFFPAEGVLEGEVENAPGIDRANGDVNSYGGCSYEPSVLHNCLPVEPSAQSATVPNSSRHSRSAAALGSARLCRCSGGLKRACRHEEDSPEGVAAVAELRGGTALPGLGG